jgi:hypothetical protein
MAITAYDRIVSALIGGNVNIDWHVVAASGLTLSQDQLDQAHDILMGITEQAKAWNWSKVTDKLDRAYKMLGAENPADGHAYHKGVHPAQLAASDPV